MDSEEIANCKLSNPTGFSNLESAVNHFLVHEKRKFPYLTMDYLINDLLPRIIEKKELKTDVDRDFKVWLEYHNIIKR